MAAVDACFKGEENDFDASSKGKVNDFDASSKGEENDSAVSILSTEGYRKEATIAINYVRSR